MRTCCVYCVLFGKYVYSFRTVAGLCVYFTHTCALINHDIHEFCMRPKMPVDVVVVLGWFQKDRTAPYPQ